MAEIPFFLRWAGRGARAVKNELTGGGDDDEQVDPSERPVDPSATSGVRALVAQMAPALNAGARKNPPVNVVAQPDAPAPVAPSGTTGTPAPPVVAPTVNPSVPVVEQPEASPVAISTRPDPSKPDAGGAYLTRAEAGEAPPMDGTRPSLQHNPADTSRGDAIKDYLSAVTAARLRPESQDFHSGDRATDLEDRRAALEAFEPQKRSWWDNLKAALPPALFAAARTGNPLAAAGALLGGVTVATADRKLADQAWRSRQLAEAGQQLQQEYSDEQQKARTRLTNAQADLTEARPGLEQAKADAQGRQRQQQALQREIGNRLKEPRAFDPNDAYDTDLTRRAQAAGVHFDPQSFGDTKNPATMEVVDPTDPTGTHKTKLVFDRASGTWRPVTVDGQGVTTGYATPVGPDGMTASQHGGQKLGEERFAETKRRNAVTETQGQQRIAETKHHNAVTEGEGAQRVQQGAQRVAQGDRHSAEGRARGAESAIGHLNELRRRADTGQTDEERKGYAAQARRQRDLIMSQYGDAVTLDEGGWPNGVKAAQAAPSSSAPKFTADEVRARARAAGKDPEAAVSAARARGLLKE